MKSDTIDIIVIAAGIIGVIVLGVLFLSLSKWARAQNRDLKIEGNDSPNKVFHSELSKGNTFGAIKGYLSGTLTMQETIIGKILSFAVIIFVSFFFIFGFFIIVRAI